IPFALAGPGANAALGIDTDQLDPWRHVERYRRFVDERYFEKVLDNRGREGTAGRQPADVARLIEPHIDAADDVRRKADKPDVFLIVCRAGLARDRFSDFAHDRRGAALYDAFHQRGDLVGGHRVDHLLPTIDQRRLDLIVPFRCVAADAFPLIMLKYRMAVAVRDAVDQRGNDAASAIVEH